MPIKNKGFTLIELIVAIGILGILAVAAIIALDPVAQLQKSNDVRRKSDLAQVQRALESYYQDHGKYPASSSYKIFDPDKTPNERPWGSSWTPYMNLLPHDPNSAYSYAYYPNLTTGQSYTLYASLEKLNSSDQCKGDLSDSANPCGKKSVSMCGGVCNFGVSSPDVSP